MISESTDRAVDSEIIKRNGPCAVQNPFLFCLIFFLSNIWGGTSAKSRFFYLNLFSLSALDTTEIELSAIAAPANIGLSSGPPKA